MTATIFQKESDKVRTSSLFSGLLSPTLYPPVGHRGKFQSRGEKSPGKGREGYNLDNWNVSFYQQSPVVDRFDVMRLD